MNINIIATLCILAPCFVSAQKLAIKTTQALIPTESNTVFAFSKDLYQLEMIDLLNKQSSILSVPSNAIGFDVATLANTTTKQALILTNDGVYKTNSDNATLLFNYQSVLNDLHVSEFEKINFIL